ncbi:MAG: hypothetical protein ACO3FI_03030 [Cyclobacteriaceae bacterium]
MENFPRLQAFFETLKNYSFWQRLFGWSALLKNIGGTWAEVVEFSSTMSRLKQEQEVLRSDLRVEKEKTDNLERRTDELKTELVKTTEKLRSQEEVHRIEKNNTESSLKSLQTENRSLLQSITELRSAEEQRKKEVYDQVQQALDLKRVLDKDRNDLHQQEQQKIRDHQEKMKKTWSEHQEQVKKKIQLVCSQQAIEYITKFSFKGIPDNAVRIADEIVIFDAKSPSSIEDLGNFKTYIRKQCEDAGKYAKQENVRKEIYMVIPSGAAEVIDSPTYVTDEYKVYIITPDAIEAVLLTLRKIEDYAFIQEIGPDERQAIVRVIGQLIYASKRRIQVDQFFNGELINILRNALSGIPENLKDEINQVELAAKLNPSMDKRSKAIALADLEHVQKQQAAIAGALEAPVPVAIEIKA